MSQFVFAYGTLRQGFMYHAYLSGTQFLGGARTENAYALYRGEYPLVVRDECVSPIMGEVYEVSDGLLTMLDALEEHPRVYCREQVPVRLDSGRLVRAWVYFYVLKVQETDRLIPGGDLHGED